MASMPSCSTFHAPLLSSCLRRKITVVAMASKAKWVLFFLFIMPKIFLVGYIFLFCYWILLGALASALLSWLGWYFASRTPEAASVIVSWDLEWMNLWFLKRVSLIELNSVSKECVHLLSVIYVFADTFINIISLYWSYGDWRVEFWGLRSTPYFKLIWLLTKVVFMERAIISCMDCCFTLLSLSRCMFKSCISVAQHTTFVYALLYILLLERLVSCLVS